MTGRSAAGGLGLRPASVTPQPSHALWVRDHWGGELPRGMPKPGLGVSRRRSRGVGAVRLSRCDYLVNERREVMRWPSMQTGSRRSRRSHRRPVPSVLSPTCRRSERRLVDAERVRDSVPLWFHTFALAPGIYTRGYCARSRLSPGGARRGLGLRGVACLTWARLTASTAFSRRPGVRGALSRSTMSSTSTGCVLALA